MLNAIVQLATSRFHNGWIWDEEMQDTNGNGTV